MFLESLMLQKKYEDLHGNVCFKKTTKGVKNVSFCNLNLKKK